MPNTTKPQCWDSVLDLKRYVGAGHAMRVLKSLVSLVVIVFRLWIMPPPICHKMQHHHQPSNQPTIPLTANNLGIGHPAIFSGRAGDSFTAGDILGASRGDLVTAGVVDD